MSYSDSMLDFINGCLEPGKESELFYALSSDEELRLELKQVLAMKSAIQDNRSYFEPPAKSTEKIFSKIGLPLVGLSSLPKPPKTEVIPSTQSFFQNYSQGLWFGLAASITTGILVFLLLTPYLSFLGGHKNEIAVNKHDKPETVKMSEFLGTSRISGIEKIVTKYVYIKNQPIVSANNDVVEYSENRIIENKPYDIRQFDNFKKPFFEKSVKVKPANPDIFIDKDISLFNEMDLSKKESQDFSIELKNTQDWMMPSPTISPSKYQMFNNISLGIKYKLSDLFTIGAEIRRENFFLRFHAFNDNGGNTFEIQPNFTTYCGDIRFATWKIDNLNTYLQVSLGFNNVGFVHRETAGIIWIPNQYISLIFGAELSNMMYNKENILYNSRKITFNYGLIFNF